MQTPEANKILERILKDFQKNGMDSAVLIPEFQKAREYALKEEDPLITRALRLAWQHLEANNSFEVPFLEDGETADENFDYFVNLMIKSTNTINRDELREMTNMLQKLA